MRRPLALLLLAPLVAGLLAVVTATAPPASAVSSRADRHDAPYPIDTRRLRLFPTFKGTVTIQALSSTYNVGRRFNGVDVYYDTTRGAGADYRVLWGLRNDGDGYQRFQLYRVRGGRTAEAVPCRGASAKYRPRVGAIEVYVPARCLVVTKRVGVRVITWDFTRYRGGIPRDGRGDAVPDRGWLR